MHQVRMGHILYSIGFRTGTPVGSKWRTLRVTTVKPCSSAVAAMSRSALSWPRVADNRPHRRAVAVSTDRILSLYQASTRSSQRANSRAKDGSRCCCCVMPRSISPTVTTQMYMSDVRCASTQRTASGIPVTPSERRQHIGVKEKHQRSSGRAGMDSRGNSWSSCGISRSS